MTMLKIKNLILNDFKKPFNLNINKACNIITGDNGIGKTTCLDYIAGILKDKNVIISGNDGLIYMNQSLFFLID